MIFKKSYVLKTLLILSGVIFFTSCEKDFNTLGVDLVEDANFDVKKQVYEVNASNVNLASVRTDFMPNDPNTLNLVPTYQLSDYTDAVFGKSKASFITQLSLELTPPTFGNLSAADEANAGAGDDPAVINENERVTKVYLDIPFFSTVSDTLDDDNLPRPYDVDSVFGDVQTPFTVTVQEYTKYLRDRDPQSNFQRIQEYFSDEDAQPFLSTVLFSGDYRLNFEELIFFDNEDDPDTEEDESQNVSSRFSPRIRLELDSQFFQERILDKEGDDVLSNQELFRDYLRGIYIGIDHPSDNLKMLLRTNDGNITIKYDYDTYNAETEAVEVARDSFSLNFQTKNFNIYEEEPYPMEVMDAVTAGVGADRLYLKGESGTIAKVDLSAGQDMEAFLNEARANEWLINEANLIFYADDQLTGNQNLPDRLFLYDFENSEVLVDYRTDAVGPVTTFPNSSYLYYGGLLDDEDGTPKYKFRVTEHIKNIISNDSTNVNLGLSVTSNIFNSFVVSAFDQDGSKVSVPQGAAAYPYSVVLYGANVSAEDQAKRVKLELIYTEPKK
ncbi:DUF4270 domain-containing protein [Robertkochia flava]|uniref:DUF4270 domain-containing protein n=1 Tax=Robertkochia flava TaxID=3447986 RepID=UPI001CCD4A6B|nr:DUF4270 domain-containing protein [Robertkochia marina]